MSNRRYIEVTSRRRDRKTYPLVSYFEVPIEESGLNYTAPTARDPIVDAFPCYCFELHAAATTPPNSPVYAYSGLGAKKFGSGSTRFIPILDTAPSSGGGNNINYYNGYRIIDITINETRTILSFDPTTQGIVLSKPFSSLWKDTDCYILVDPSVPFDNNVFQNNPGTVTGSAANPILDFTNATLQIPLLNNFPLNGFPGGYFSGAYLQIIDPNTQLVLEEQVIQEFIQLGVGSFQYKVDLDSNFTLSWYSPSWGFRILWYGPFIHLQPLGTFDTKNPASYNQFYTGFYCFNEKTNEGKKIIGYSAEYKVAILEEGFSVNNDFNPVNTTIPIGPTGSFCPSGPVGVTGSYTGANTGIVSASYPDIMFSIRKGLPCYVGGYTGSNKGSSTLCFNPSQQYLESLPSENGVWGTSTRSPDCCTPYQINNKYVFIRPISYGLFDSPSEKNLYLIKEYFGASGYSGPLGTFPPYCALLDRPIEIPLLGTGTCEVLPFSRDNFAPLFYNGSTVSQQEHVCYEIRLVSVVLPNVILLNGSRISFYPYVYVQFGTTSGSSTNHTNGVIWSNNPETRRALFIAPTTDIANPLSSQFVKLDGSGAVQTVKFKPNDNLVFSVYLPNGDLFQTLEPDHYSPKEPNSLLQVEAVFEIRRL